MAAQIGTYGALSAINHVSGAAGPVISPTVSSTATAGGTTTLTDSTKAWTINQWTGFTITITGGTGSGETAVIISNTATILTVASWSIATPTTSSTYTITPTWHPGMSWINTTPTTPQNYRWNSAAWVPAPCTSVATSGSVTTLADTTRAWNTNQFAGYTVNITNGTGAGQSAVITSNTATTLTFPTITTAPAAGSVYNISSRYLALLVADPVLAGAVNLSDLNELSIGGYSRQPVSFNAATAGYPGLVSNSSDITFGPISTTMTVPVSWAALVDVPSGTTGYYLADWNGATPMQVDASQSIQIGVGSLVLQDQ